MEGQREARLAEKKHTYWQAGRQGFKGQQPARIETYRTGCDQHEYKCGSHEYKCELNGCGYSLFSVLSRLIHPHGPRPTSRSWFLVPHKRLQLPCAFDKLTCGGLLVVAIPAVLKAPPPANAF